MRLEVVILRLGAESGSVPSTEDCAAPGRLATHDSSSKCGVASSSTAMASFLLLSILSWDQYGRRGILPMNAGAERVRARGENSKSYQVYYYCDNRHS